MGTNAMLEARVALRASGDSSASFYLQCGVRLLQLIKQDVLVGKLAGKSNISAAVRKQIPGDPSLNSKASRLDRKQLRDSYGSGFQNRLEDKAPIVGNRDLVRQ